VDVAWEAVPVEPCCRVVVPLELFWWAFVETWFEVVVPLPDPVLEPALFWAAMPQAAVTPSEAVTAPTRSVRRTPLVRRMLVVRSVVMVTPRVGILGWKPGMPSR